MIYIMVVGVKAYDGQRQQVSFQTGKLPQLAQYTEAPAVSQSDKLQHDPSLTSVMFGFLDWSSLLVGTLGPAPLIFVIAHMEADDSHSRTLDFLLAVARKLARLPDNQSVRIQASSHRAMAP